MNKKIKWWALVFFAGSLVWIGLICQSIYIYKQHNKIQELEKFIEVQIAPIELPSPGVIGYPYFKKAPEVEILKKEK